MSLRSCWKSPCHAFTSPSCALCGEPWNSPMFFFLTNKNTCLFCRTTEGEVKAWQGDFQQLRRDMFLQKFVVSLHHLKKNCIFFSFEEQYLVWAKSFRNFTYETTYCKVLHTIFDKRGAILWWLFEELLKVFTWLVGFPYQLSIISALIRKYIANFRWKQVENLRNGMISFLVLVITIGISLF
jgi:hypothetical protein